jgi:tripartite-type tricarboxylate transporter receptor subunit TctC
MWRCFGCIVIIAALAAGEASAQEAVAEFYKGRQITVIVGSSAGGGYDIYARLVSRHLPKHIPGNPAVVMARSIRSNLGSSTSH